MKHEENTQDFKTALVELRKSRGWSQAQLAVNAGVSARSVQVWEAGGNLPRGKALRRLAETFGVDTAELRAGTVRTQPPTGAAPIPSGARIQFSKAWWAKAIDRQERLAQFYEQAGKQAAMLCRSALEGYRRAMQEAPDVALQAEGEPPRSIVAPSHFIPPELTRDQAQGLLEMSREEVDRRPGVEASGADFVADSDRRRRGPGRPNVSVKGADETGSSRVPSQVSNQPQ